jgi:hypothetical protein
LKDCVSPCQFYSKPHGLSLRLQCTNELRFNLSSSSVSERNRWQAARHEASRCTNSLLRSRTIRRFKSLLKSSVPETSLSFIRSKSSSLMMEAQKASETLDFDPASARIIFRERITVIITYSRLNPCNDRPWHRRLSCRNTNVRNTPSL